jgi:hypothetical protein
LRNRTVPISSINIHVLPIIEHFFSICTFLSSIKYITIAKKYSLIEKNRKKVCPWCNKVYTFLNLTHNVDGAIGVLNKMSLGSLRASVDALRSKAALQGSKLTLGEPKAEGGGRIYTEEG